MTRDAYCHSCYRTLEDGRTSCAACRDAGAPIHRVARLPLTLGTIAIPLLLGGFLTLGSKACLWGGVIAGAAAVVHVAILVARR